MAACFASRDRRVNRADHVRVIGLLSVETSCKSCRVAFASARIAELRLVLNELQPEILRQLSRPFDCEKRRMNRNAP